MIGVSSAPQSIFGNIFARTDNRYALVIMNDRNSFIHITEHELSLEEANVFALELSTRYMPSARLLMGESDTELVADASTGDVSSRLVQQNLMTMIDATVLPALQAFAGLLITAVIVTSVMIGLNRLAGAVFATDLMVSHQPISQLFIRPEPRAENKPVASPGQSQTVASATAPVENATQSAPIAIATATTPQIAPAEAQPQTASAAETTITGNLQPDTASTAVFAETTLYQASESHALPASHEPASTEEPMQIIASSTLTPPPQTPAEAIAAVPASPTIQPADTASLPVADPFKVSYST